MALTYSAPAVKITLKIIESYGIQAEDLLQKMEIDPKLLNDPNARCSYTVVDDLWFEATQIANDSAFGLKAAEFWHPSHLGALGYAWLSSSTLKTALNRFQRYSRILTEGANLEIEENAKTMSVVLQYNAISRQQPTRTDSFMAMLLAMCRANYGANFHPYEIHLKHPAPEKTSAFFELFGCPVNFDAEDNRFILNMADALKPLEGSHPQIAQLNDQIMIEYLAKMDKNNVMEQVKAEIIKQLPSGNVTDETVASELFMNERTLQRRLKEQGTTFKTLMNEVREDLANAYIRDSSLSLSEISFLLGFGNISSFSRAFKSWTGSAPSELRSN